MRNTLSTHIINRVTITYIPY